MKRLDGALVREAMIAIAYSFWAIWLTVPLIFRMADGLPKDRGDPLLNTWILVWETQALTERPSSIFDAPIFYPHARTLAYSEPLLGILPFALPFILATGIPALGYNVAFLSSFWIAAMGMYRLTRAAGGQRRAAFVAGFLFAALPYRFAHLMHIQLLYLGWIPLAMAAWIRYVQRPTWRRAGDLILTVLLMALSTWHLAVFGAIALSLLGLRMAWEGRIAPRAWPGLGGVVLACGLGIAPVAWPYLQIAPELARVRTLSLAHEFAAWPVDVLAASPDLRLLGPLTAPFRMPGHTTHEVQLYVGLGISSAALLGMRSSPGSSLRWSSLVLVGIGALMALGPFWTLGPWQIPGPYALAAALIPGITLIRAVARWFILTLIGLATLAGLGLDHILRGRCWGIALLWLGLGILEGLAIPIPIVPLPRPADLPEVYHWLASQPGKFAVLELPVFLPLDADETIRMYGALVHRKPLVIAYSGYIPPDIREIRERLLAFPQPGALAEIVRLSEQGVRYVLVDRSQVQQFYIRGLCEVSRNPHFRYAVYMDPYDVFEVLPNPEPLLSPMRPIKARFGDVAILRGYGVRWLSPGRLEVGLVWEAGPQPHGSYSITVQAFDEQGEKRAQRDGAPQNNGYPFHCWQPGEQILDLRVLEGSEEELSRISELRIAIYEWPSLVRLNVESAYPVVDRMLRLPLR
ncbi:hypothetical protein [Thermoflexus sp.]|uniref:hypothetical protein n=1 Tax=Thermoflexus sp. TaxID=1969742 RepID=UPI002ADD791B|nr:hypothetical protein [Thermoflexus sp.]